MKDREAIEAYLRQLQRQTVDEEISAWAREMAGTEYDLDPDFAEAALEFLSQDEAG